eukprot:g1525.t1
MVYHVGATLEVRIDEDGADVWCAAIVQACDDGQLHVSYTRADGEVEHVWTDARGADVRLPGSKRARDDTDDEPSKKRVLTTTRSGREVMATDGAVREVKASSGVDNDHHDWLCALCNAVESPQGADDALLCCDGGCLRTFHLSCLFLDAAPAQERWLCPDCTSGSHKCFACGRFGRVDQDVFKCSLHACGKYFHAACAPGAGATGFKCPAHKCATCGQKRSAPLVRCLLCPRAFHANCVPPFANYNHYFMICGDHPNQCLPCVPRHWDGGDESDEEAVAAARAAAEESAAASSLRFPRPRLKRMCMQRAPSARRAKDPQHFRLPTAVLTEVQSRPAPFKLVRSNVYLRRATRALVPDETACECTGACDDECFNRIMHVECVGEPVGGAAAGKGKGKGRASRLESNCCVGGDCGNRRLQLRQHAKLALFRTPWGGWGLRLLQGVREGDLITEYVGEVIDEATSEQRCQEHRRRHPRDPNFYVMALGQDEYIDARFKGNLARFINHSCEPNCHLNKWNVGGYTRIGIIAKTDLAKGTEITYDYDFSTHEAHAFKCFCGAKRCRGSLASQGHDAGAADEEAVDQPRKRIGKRERAELLRRAREAHVRRAEEREAAKLLRVRGLSFTGAKLPGDKSGAPVSAGPPVKHRGTVLDCGVFLWRNAMRGQDFVGRATMRQPGAALARPPFDIDAWLEKRG